MAKVELITAGEQKFTQLKQLETDYEKKISRFIKFSIKSVKVKNIKDEKKLIREEGDRILSSIEKRDFLVALDRRGQEMSSQDFAEFISKTTLGSGKKVVFVIGSASGISEKLITRADKLLSFSKMTFPHDLFKIVFLEQLYRAYTIINRQKYHR